MTTEETRALELNAECIAFSKYLIGQEPTPFVQAKYRDAHRTNATLRALRPGAFERLLLALCLLSGVTARLADAYTCLFVRGSAVRKKMVLLLAILESCAPTYTLFETVEGEGASAFALRLLRQSITFAMVVIVAVALLMPLQFVGAAAAILWRSLRALGRIVLPTERPFDPLAQMHDRPADGEPETQSL